MSRRLRTMVWLGLAALVPAFGAFEEASGAPVPTAGCATGWTQTPTPNPGGEVDQGLSSLAVVAANDVWAVGGSGVYGAARSTLAVHWNGSSWAAVPTPNGSNEVNWLLGVDSVTTSDVWAVGYSDTNPPEQAISRTLIEHWNGATWSVVPSPNPTPPLSGGPYSNTLHDVAAVAANDVWAVGQTHDYGAGQTLIVHWNGSTWNVVSAPHPGEYSWLRSVTAVTANDVWAVGTHYVQGNQRTLVLHWNGSTWQVVPSPNDGPYVQELFAVDAVAANDIWAVGYHNALFGVNQRFQTSIFHWNGTAWSVVPSPDVNQNHNYLFGVAGSSATDAWAVGFYDNDQFQLRTMIQHWDGTAWSIVPSPDVSDDIDELAAVATVGPGETWAVGQSAGFFDFDTLALHRATACSTTIHVAAIDAVAVPSRATVNATVTIVDGPGAPVPGAAVTVVVTKPGGIRSTLTRQTSSAGKAFFSTSAPRSGTYTFTVRSVAKSGTTYDPSANVQSSASVVMRR